MCRIQALPVQRRIFLESSDSGKHLQDLMDKKLNMNSQCNSLAKRATSILGCINSGVVIEKVILLMLALRRMKIEHCPRFCCSLFKREGEVLKMLREDHKNNSRSGKNVLQEG